MITSERRQKQWKGHETEKQSKQSKGRAERKREVSVEKLNLCERRRNVK